MTKHIALQQPNSWLNHHTDAIPPDLLGKVESNAKRIQFKNGVIRLYGKTIAIPRRYAAFSRCGTKTYKFSGTTHTSEPMPKELVDMCNWLEETYGQHFNYVFANEYKGCHQYIGAHSDNEKEMVPQSLIASVSLFQKRDFIVRAKKPTEETGKKEKHILSLEHGDIAIMGGDMQRHYTHEVPKCTKGNSKRKSSVGKPHKCGTRINLTFRLFK